MSTTTTDKENIKKRDSIESLTLNTCPFCHGRAHFEHDNVGLNICHFPDLGVVCPARMLQHCENYDMGRRWWNDRDVKSIKKIPPMCDVCGTPHKMIQHKKPDGTKEWVCHGTHVLEKS